uniref:Uncharacterized protein n=1 Tax=Anguilla anguilla TaxID=7936 RepID=A0A0E9UBX7_ANGAN
MAQYIILRKWPLKIYSSKNMCFPQM